MSTLTHFSESLLEHLRTNIDQNLERYLGDGFEDLATEQGWALTLDQAFDLSALATLDGSDNGASADRANTLIIDAALGHMSPSLANEERLWARVSHIEAFRYTKQRWLTKETSTDKQVKAVTKHFFARGQTGIRDDHALSRLWWNAFIVRRCYDGDFRRGLELLLHTADVRSNIVERIWLTGRRVVASAVFRIMDNDPRVLASELAFREFMKALNLVGGGVVFEAMAPQKLDELLRRCADSAQVVVEQASTRP